MPSLSGGFADPVFGAQSAFRALLDALANPGRPQALPVAAPPPGLRPELAAIALTLCDHDTPLWLDAHLQADAAIIAWLRFHTGAPLTADPASAQFALAGRAAALPPLSAFAMGTDAYPDRSTTIVLVVDSFAGGAPLILTGPGIEAEITIAPVGLPVDFTEQWRENREKFPRGVDLVLAAEGAALGLPRTSRIGEA